MINDDKQEKNENLNNEYGDIITYVSSELKIPKEKMNEAKDIIKKSILFLIKDDLKRNLEYLEDSIEIEFPKSINCEWENGEVIYYIPNSYTENKFLLF